jgi:hypothetical protein
VALFDIEFKFFERYAKKSIWKSRLCDVRIESILLDVNKNENTESLWRLSALKTKNSNDGLQLKDKTAYVDLVSPFARNAFLGGAF